MYIYQFTKGNQAHGEHVASRGETEKSNTIDIFLTASRGEILTKIIRTRDQWAESYQPRDVASSANMQLSCAVGFRALALPSHKRLHLTPEI